MKKGHLIIAASAAVLFTWVIARMGLPSMVQQLKAARIALPTVLALSTLRLYLQSLTWSASLKSQDLSVDKTKLAAVRLASQSMGYLTVLGPVISEPMKIKLLGTSPKATINATFLDDGVYWFTSALIAISGVVSLPFIAAHGTVYHSLPEIIALAVMVLLITRRTPVLSTALRAFGNRAPKWLIRAESSEASIRIFRL